MLYLKCPTCKNILGNKQVAYSVMIEELYKGLTQDEIRDRRDEINKKKKEFLEILKIDKYCCTMRLISYTPLINIVK